MIDPGEDVDELIRRARLPRREPAKPRRGVHWLTIADSRKAQQRNDLARRQPGQLKRPVARIVGEILS